MRTLHVGLRVSDLQRSLAFCQAVGYTVLGAGVPPRELGVLSAPGPVFPAGHVVKYCPVPLSRTPGLPGEGRDRARPAGVPGGPRDARGQRHVAMGQLAR